MRRIPYFTVYGKAGLPQNIARGGLNKCIEAELMSLKWRQVNAWDDRNEHIIMLNNDMQSATYVLKPLSPTAPRQPE